MRALSFLPVLLLLGCPGPAGDSDAPAEDRDGDGYTTDQDCDDRNNTVHPGALELCGNQIDDDCDGQVDDDGVGSATFWPDRDDDGFGDDTGAITACAVPDGFVANDEDCDDADGRSFPGGDDSVCDGVDQDCDEQVDEHATTFTVYQDADSDGFGSPAATRVVCRDEVGWVRDDTDCNDGASETYPGAPEACDGQDQDCDAVPDNGVEGSGAACAAASCQAVLDLRPGVASGSYWLLDDLDAFEATCDMETESGGWTLVDLELAEARGWMVAYPIGVASRWRGEWDLGKLILSPARTTAEQEEHRCRSAIVRADIELPFEFARWRGDVTVAYDGDDTIRAEPKELVDGPTTGDCTEGAFLVGAEDDLAKIGGAWGEAVNSRRGSRTITWTTMPLVEPTDAFFFEINGSNTEGRFSLVDHSEHAAITRADIWVR